MISATLIRRHIQNIKLLTNIASYCIAPYSKNWFKIITNWKRKIHDYIQVQLPKVRNWNGPKRGFSKQSFSTVKYLELLRCNCLTNFDVLATVGPPPVIRCARPPGFSQFRITIPDNNQQFWDIGSFITYGCSRVDYELEGASSARCESSGQFSAPPPFCRPVGESKSPNVTLHHSSSFWFLYKSSVFIIVSSVIIRQRLLSLYTNHYRYSLSTVSSLALNHWSVLISILFINVLFVLALISTDHYLIYQCFSCFIAQQCSLFIGREDTNYPT